jgi:hypothetical protein
MVFVITVWLQETYLRHSTIEPEVVQVPLTALNLHDENFVVLNASETPAAKKRIVIIIPYRDRKVQLDLQLLNLNNLARSEWDMQVMVVEQNDQLPFKRGWLLNVGYDILKQNGQIQDVDCLTFHDVDTLGTSLTRYDWCDEPTLICSEYPKWYFRPPYEEYIGGVVAISPKDFNSSNGFSNVIQGWGGEDDDFYHRAFKVGKVLTDGRVRKPPRGEGYCYSIEENHPERVRDEQAYREVEQKLRAWNSVFWDRINIFADGLTTVQSTYTLRSVHNLIDPRTSFKIRAARYVINQKVD